MDGHKVFKEESRDHRVTLEPRSEKVKEVIEGPRIRDINKKSISSEGSQCRARSFGNRENGGFVKVMAANIAELNWDGLGSKKTTFRMAIRDA
jgi:hypothetical protein